MILTVASGKGGTGKTLVSTSLALSLQQSEKVQVLDCDVEEPNSHIFIKPDISESRPVYIPVPQIDEDTCTHCGKCSQVCAYNALAVTPKIVLTFAELCHGCGACSYLCPVKAITEVDREIGTLNKGERDNILFCHGELNIGEALAPPIIRQVKKQAQPDYTIIIDAPPGTSCPVVESMKNSDFCILVTEPTPFGLNDLDLAVETTRELGIPSGVILNRAGDNDKSVETYCEEKQIPLLLKIPFDREIAHLYSKGIPLVEGMPEWRERFIEVFTTVREMVYAGSSDTQR